MYSTHFQFHLSAKLPLQRSVRYSNYVYFLLRALIITLYITVPQNQNERNNALREATGM